jgi:hypothetical protein
MLVLLDVEPATIRSKTDSFKSDNRRQIDLTLQRGKMPSTLGDTGRHTDIQ